MSARAERGMTQRDVERAARIAQGRISRIERGIAAPLLTEVAQIADVVGLHLALVIEPRPDDRR